MQGTFARLQWSALLSKVKAVMHSKVITTWFVMDKSFNANTSNSHVGIADHAVVDATFLMDLSQMLLLLQHVGYHADWHFGTVPHC